MPKKKIKSFGISQGLQDSLEETITSAKEYSGELNISAIPLNKLELDPNNPRDLAITAEDVIYGLAKSDPDYQRKQNEKKELEYLASTIQEQGLINPILVYKHDDKYKLVAGERRSLASLLLGQKSVQAKILDGRPDNLKISLLQWIENIQREDLSLAERLHNLEGITTSYLSAKNLIIDNLTSEKLAELLGISLSQAAQYKIILNAPSKIKEHIINGQIKNLDKAAFISKASPEYHDLLISELKKGSSVKQLKLILENEKLKQSQSPSKERRGRQATRINLGVTKNKKLAKIILQSVVDHEQIKPYIKDLNDIDWQDTQSINNAFKDLINLIEKII